jgi:SSS family solute:Na+ symporter
MAAQYGAQAFHFYWIGAIPAIIFLALWMMPVYCRSGVRSIPEYLEVRYGGGIRGAERGVEVSCRTCFGIE